MSPMRIDWESATQVHGSGQVQVAKADPEAANPRESRTVVTPFTAEDWRIRASFEVFSGGQPALSVICIKHRAPVGRAAGTLWGVKICTECADEMEFPMDSRDLALRHGLPREWIEPKVHTGSATQRED